jgi:hypothetical protein
MLLFGVSFIGRNVEIQEGEREERREKEKWREESLLCSEWRYLRANTRGIIRYRETEGKLGISCGQLDINMGKTGQKLGKTGLAVGHEHGKMDKI